MYTENESRSWKRPVCMAGVCLGLILFAAVHRARAAEGKADYGDMLKFSGATTLRMPTQDEMKTLGSLWPDMPAGENGAYHLAKAASLVNAQGAPAGSLSSGAPYDGNQKAFQQWVARNQPALVVAGKALTFETCQLPVFMNVNPVLPIADMSALAQLRNLGRAMTDAGFLAELDMKPDEAARRYLDVLLMGARVRVSGPQIVNLIGVAFSMKACENLESLVANVSLSEKALQDIFSCCERAAIARGELARAIKAEREFAEVSMRMNGAILKVHPMSIAMRSYFTDVMLLHMKNVDAPFRIAVMDQVKKKGQGKVVAPAIERGLLQAAWLETRIRALQLRVAIRLYELRHNGAAPDTLEALVPDILPAFPEDPFTGQPFHYERKGDNWRLWSVGPDGKDNGGAQQAKPSLKDADYVFPSAVPTNLKRRMQAE